VLEQGSVCFGCYFLDAVTWLGSHMIGEKLEEEGTVVDVNT
jgi:hypothetical protein